MTFETIVFEETGGVARLALNRPDKLNSFNNLMHEELHTCLQSIGDGWPVVRRISAKVPMSL